MNTYELSFVIHELPKMANPSGAKSTHWRYAKLERDRWQKLVEIAVMGLPRPERPLKRYRLFLVRYSSTQPDYDGLVRGFKHTIDSLVVLGFLENDRLENTGAWDCTWEKGMPKKGKIFVNIKERD